MISNLPIAYITVLHTDTYSVSRLEDRIRIREGASTVQFIVHICFSNDTCVGNSIDVVVMVVLAVAGVTVVGVKRSSRSGLVISILRHKR